MTGAALCWAFQQNVRWPLAKLLLSKIGDVSHPEAWEETFTLDALVEFSGAHSHQEVVGALNYLADTGLAHLTWFAPPDEHPEIAFGARTCDPECGICRAPAPKAAPSWVIARREWERLRGGIMPVLYARDGQLCRVCGATNDLSGDHVIPLRLGGTNALPNLQVLCRPCNRRKGYRIDTA